MLNSRVLPDSLQRSGEMRAAAVVLTIVLAQPAMAVTPQFGWSTALDRGPMCDEVSHSTGYDNARTVSSSRVVVASPVDWTGETASWHDALLASPLQIDFVVAPSSSVMDGGAVLQCDMVADRAPLCDWSSRLGIPYATEWVPPWPMTRFLEAKNQNDVRSTPMLGMHVTPLSPPVAPMPGKARSDSYVAAWTGETMTIWAARMLIVAVLFTPILCVYLLPRMFAPRRARAPCAARPPNIDEPNWIVG